jgi:hypothetical protein
VAVPLLGLLLAPMAGIFTGLVFARNADKSAAISSALAKRQQDTQLAIAESQQTTQLAIAYRNLEQSREIANRQQETQLKLAYLNIAYQARLEERREDLEMSRQQFQERMENLRFGQQLTLEQTRQAFQLKFNSLQHQQQLEIQGFIQSVNLAISERNLDFQKWRTQQEMSLQKELATYNRQTQFAIAAYQRETAFLLPQVHKIFENWPLTLVPAQILDSHHSNGVVPMRVVISPPEVDFDKFERSPNQHFPKIEKRLAEGLGQFLSTNSPDSFGRVVARKAIQGLKYSHTTKETVPWIASPVKVFLNSGFFVNLERKQSLAKSLATPRVNLDQRLFPFSSTFSSRYNG